MVGLGRGNAEERMALLLLDLHGRLALAGQIDAAATGYDCPMTQQQVADLLGLTNVHVSRVLRTLREERIATMRAGRVQITDLARLGKLAHPLLDVFEHAEPAYGRRGP
jgi:CRP/FNR family transcriptional regulator